MKDSIVATLNHEYIKTGNYLNTGDVFKSRFIEWCIVSGVIPDDTPLSVARNYIDSAWYISRLVCRAFYTSLHADGLWQAGYDAMTEDETQARLVVALEKQMEAVE